LGAQLAVGLLPGHMFITRADQAYQTLRL